MIIIDEKNDIELQNKTEETEEIENSSIALLPPWYIVWEKINGAIGYDKLLEVKPMFKNEDSMWQIDIISNSYIKARSLAAILNTKYDYGNNSIKVNIYFNNQIVEEPEYTDSIPVKYLVKTLIEKAFRDNLLFECVLDKGIFEEKEGQLSKIADALDADLALVFKKEIIQFYADDLSDLFLNYNIVAADVFEDITKSEVFGERLTFTTEPDSLINYIEK